MANPQTENGHTDIANEIMENPPNKKIPGGYILKARKIDKSWISKAPPHIREIWDWILRNVNFQDKMVGGKLIKRGQRLITWHEIIEDLSWMVGYRKMKYKKHHCEIAMNALTKQTMITTAKTTRGTIVTVCNYDYYQTPKNYDNDCDNVTITTAKTTGYGNDKQEREEYKELKKGSSPFPLSSPNTLKIESAHTSRSRQGISKTTNPNIKIFIDWYSDQFQSIFGEKPKIEGGKDGALIKRLLQTYDLPKLIELGEMFFQSDDSFIQQSGYTIGVFSSVINKLIASKTKNRDPTYGKYQKGPDLWYEMKMKQLEEEELKKDGKK